MGHEENKKDKKMLLINHESIINFDSLAKKVKPFDLIGFCASDFVSNTISSVQKYYLGTDQFSHVSMIVTADILPYFFLEGEKIYLDPNVIYILESTIPYSLTNFDVVPDIFSGKSQMGVQLHNLKDVISSYLKDHGSSVCWCKLSDNPFDQIDNRPEISRKFIKIFGEYYGRMYDADLISLTGSVFPFLRGIRDIKDYFYTKLYSLLGWVGLTKKNNRGPAEWQFCSELVANIYIYFDIIPKTFNPKDVVPADFFGFDKDGLPLLVDDPIFIFSDV